MDKFELLHPGSIVFDAACNEAVEAPLRPIRKRVVRRLAELCETDSQVSKLLSDTWAQAENETSIPRESLWRGKLVGNKFVELLARDPLWKTLVLNHLVQERSWSDLWSRGYETLSDWLLSLLEKLVSPSHPAARFTIGALTSLTTVVAVAWIPIAIDGKNIYETIFTPLVKPFLSKSTGQLEIKTKADGEGLLHLKVTLDDRDLSATLRPVIQPNELKVAFHPTTDASLRITPQIQYSSNTVEKAGPGAGKLQALNLRLAPALDFSTLPTDLWGPKGGLKVSVTELGDSGKPSGLAPASSSGNVAAEPSTRPLDKIEADLKALGAEFQAANSDQQSSVAGLQQKQNTIHSIAANQGRTTVIQVNPNSVRSVVLQWVGENSAPRSCVLTLQATNIKADKLDVSVTKQQCSRATPPLIEHVPVRFPVGPGQAQPLGPWILSVDETRPHWIFQRAAMLRFTWQPGLGGTTLTSDLAKTLR